MTTIQRIYLALAFFGTVIVVGTVGYIVIDDADPFSALYMTVITVSTVGYGEAVQLDGSGRLFTIIIIILGLASTTLLTVTVVAFLVEGEFRKIFRSRSMQRRMRRMKDHFIICGLGQTGKSVLNEFMAVKSDCVIIEKNQEVIDEVTAQHPSLVMLHGDATTDEMLEEARVDKAKGLIAATESDSDNLLITLTARSMNKDMTITARATRTENYNKLKVAGASHVVMPNEIGGMRMASTLLRPQVVDFLDVMMRGSGETLRMEQARVPKKSSVIGQPLSKLEIPKKTGLLVLAIRRDDGQYVFSPTSSETLKQGDTIIVAGHSEKMESLYKLLEGKL